RHVARRGGGPETRCNSGASAAGDRDDSEAEQRPAGGGRHDRLDPVRARRVGDRGRLDGQLPATSAPSTRQGSVSSMTRHVIERGSLAVSTATSSPHRSPSSPNRRMLLLLLLASAMLASPSTAAAHLRSGTVAVDYRATVDHPLTPAYAA